MKRSVALISLLIVIGGIVVLLMGCPPPVVRIRPPEPRVEVYGAPPHPDAVWRPGYWHIGEGSEFGYQATGQDRQGPMPFGFLVIGRREEGGGSGLKGIGGIVK